MNNFCTFFDINYLTRGLALYQSLKKHCPEFTLYVIAFDNRCFDILHDLDYPEIIPIRLTQMEESDSELCKVKERRTFVEYFWTSTPSVIKYCIEKFNLEYCTYLDADIFFFSDPSILLQELVDKRGDVLITEHRYTPCYDQTDRLGRFCVQFMTFKNNPNGMKILEWFRDACIKWCHNFCEDGKFGDQKYLDDWPERFENVVVLEHLGGGVAPWNVQQYDIVCENEKVFIQHGNKQYSLVFYHFHELKIFEGYGPSHSGYHLSSSVKKFIYEPYLSALNQTLPENSEQYHPGTNFLPIALLKNFKRMTRYFFAKWGIWQN